MAAERADVTRRRRAGRPACSAPAAQRPSRRSRRHSACCGLLGTPARAADRTRRRRRCGGAGGCPPRRMISRVTLVEIDPALAALARENAARNGLAERVRAVCLDVAAPAGSFRRGWDLGAGAADHVLMNPPFNAAHNPSPDRGRRLAHAAALDTLGRWVETAAWLLRPGRRSHADLAGGRTRCGARRARRRFRRASPSCRSTPSRARRRSGCWSRAVKASRAPLALLPGLVLTDGSGQPTPAAEAVLREGAVLRWRKSNSNPLIRLAGQRKENVGRRTPRSDAAVSIARHRRGRQWRECLGRPAQRKIGNSRR